MFITFEGPEGGGKTSQIETLAIFLRQQGRAAVPTREPGGTPIGDQIRRVLMDHRNAAMVPRTEILLFLASRAQHVEELIRPHLARRAIVLCDRYTDSTLAYQGYGHGVNLDELRTLNRFATAGLAPDLTLLLDVDVETGLKRRQAGGAWNRLDAYALAFHQRVRQGYHTLVQAEPARWVVIDANKSPEEVALSIRAVVETRLSLHTTP